MRSDKHPFLRAATLMFVGLAIYAQSIPVNASAPSSPNPFKDQVITREQRTMGLVTVYSLAKQHFALFDDLPKLDWDKTFIEYIPLVEKDQSLYDYYRVLQRFNALLEDGHTTISFPTIVQKELDELPIRANIVEGKWVIVTRFPTKEVLKEDIPRGSELLSIEGIPPAKYYADKFYPYIAAGREQFKRQKLSAYALYPKNTPIKVALRYPDGSSHERVLKANAATVNWSDESLLAKYIMPWSVGPGFASSELDGGILYIAFRSCDRDSENKIVKLLESRKSNWPKGVILDLRANRGGSSPEDLIAHLISQRVEWYEALSRWSLSYMTAQTKDSTEAQAAEWLKGRGLSAEFSPKWYRMPWSLTPAKIHYDGPLAILTSPTTGSAAEDVVALLQQAGRGKVIGDRTAGATGQPLSFDLPGGGSGRVCTMKCRYLDGREFQKVGCPPDILVTPTLKGITEARDEVLEVALKYIRSSAAL